MPLWPEPVQLSKFFGITASGLLTGTIISQSTVATPLLLASTNHEIILRQFKALTRQLGRPVTTAALIASLSYFATAYLRFTTHSRVRHTHVLRYLAAGAAVMMVLPYRWLVMRRTEGKLHRLYEEEVEGLGFAMRSKEGEVVVKGEVRQLVDWWGLLNLGRGVPAAVGFILGVWGSL
ncbi:hypothetical protein TWF696_003279 [Orbilia brochopaga]|uniref:DUF1772-domain-containing protein n=1 Tax=Orbilia brochopaga TaxID=3140254 RepID=A0AAV9TY38_9PEZI